jgi:hypothetical protein
MQSIVMPIKGVIHESPAYSRGNDIVHLHLEQESKLDRQHRR